MKRIVIIASVIFISVQIKAQIATDRPDQTESALTVNKGDLQIESGILLGYDGNSNAFSRQILLPTNLFRYGLTEAIELRIVNQFETLRLNSSASLESLTYQGLSDMQIGTKIQIQKDENKNSIIAFLAHLVVPTGSNGLTSSDFGIINKISISHNINDNMGLGYNVGYSYFGEGTSSLTYSAALGIGINDKVSMYVEPFGEIVGLEEGEFILNFDAGFTYLLNDNLQFDFSFGTGLTQRMNYLSVGCSWLINPEKKEQNLN